MKKALAVLSLILIIVGCTNSKEATANKQQKVEETKAVIKSTSKNTDARGNYLK